MALSPHLPVSADRCRHTGTGCHENTDLVHYSLLKLHYITLKLNKLVFLQSFKKEKCQNLSFDKKASTEHSS